MLLNYNISVLLAILQNPTDAANARKKRSYIEEETFNEGGETDESEEEEKECSTQVCFLTLHHRCKLRLHS